MPSIKLSSRTATGLGALAIGSACAAAPTVSTVFATSIAAPTTCTVSLAAHTPGSDLPVLSTTRVPAVAGKVEIRGSVKAAAKSGTEFVVVGCTAIPAKQLAVRTYLILKAPKSDRYLAVVTQSASIDKDGHVGVVAADYALPSNERGFNESIKELKRKLTLPGLKGTVYVRDSGSPLELLASRAGGKKVKQTTKVKLAKAYLGTGGYTSFPKTGPYAQQ